jgi:hypothetical protein
MENLRKQTKQRATHNKYFKEFTALTVSVEKALAYFVTHPATVLGLFGCYCEERGLLPIDHLTQSPEQESQLPLEVVVTLSCFREGQ